MNREAMIEAATVAARQLFTVVLDELENVVRQMREERPVAEEPVDTPLEVSAEAEAAPVVEEIQEESVQQKVEQVKKEANDAVQDQPSSPTRMALRSRGRRYYEVEDADLLQIEQRLRLKAEGSRWAAKSKQLLQTETELLGRDLLERERELPDCDLWMIRPTFVGSQDAADLELLGGNFEAAAESVSLLRDTLEHIDGQREFFQDAIALVAEAQSALRVGIESVHLWDDADQARLHSWLRRTTWQRQIYIERHMRLGDAADPADWQDLLGRVNNLRQVFGNRVSRSASRDRLMNELQIATEEIQRGINVTDKWPEVLSAIEGLIDNGVPPSNIDMRSLVLPVYDQLPIPEDVPNGLRLFIRETDRYRSELVEASGDHPNEPEGPSSQVAEVARRLSGKKVVLIGGDPTPHAKEAIEEAFGLAELIWIETTHGSSYLDFAPAVGQPDVAVVLLVIRWSSHSFGKVQRICNRFQKPLVRLPTGYNPNQVAAAILSQASDRLG